VYNSGLYDCDGICDTDLITAIETERSEGTLCENAKCKVASYTVSLGFRWFQTNFMINNVCKP